MPVSITNSRAVYDGMKACGIRLISTVPETWLVELVRLAEADPDMTLVHVATEQEAVGISMGAYFADVRSSIVMQNHGLLACINSVVSGAQLYRVPLLMLVSYRGEFGERDPWQTEGGAVTEDVLRALRVPFSFIESPGEAARRIAAAQTLAYAANKPVAVLLRRDLLWEDAA